MGLRDLQQVGITDVRIENDLIVFDVVGEGARGISFRKPTSYAAMTKAVEDLLQQHNFYGLLALVMLFGRSPTLEDLRTNIKQAKGKSLEADWTRTDAASLQIRSRR